MTFRRNIAFFFRAESNPSKKPSEAGSMLNLLGLLFDPEHRGDMFFQNIGLSPSYTVIQPRKQYFSPNCIRVIKSIVPDL
jgi:hypothetical protein